MDFVELVSVDSKICFVIVLPEIVFLRSYAVGVVVAVNENDFTSSVLKLVNVCNNLAMGAGQSALGLIKKVAIDNESLNLKFREHGE